MLDVHLSCQNRKRSLQKITGRLNAVKQSYMSSSSTLSWNVMDFEDSGNLLVNSVKYAQNPVL